MLHIFNNNIYTDFRTAYKHLLIPISIIWVMTEPKSHKLNINWLLRWNRRTSTFEMEPTEPYLFYKVFKKHIQPPQANICIRNSLSPPGHSYFLIPLFKIWDWTLSPSRKGEERGGGMILWYYRKFFLHVAEIYPDINFILTYIPFIYNAPLTDFCMSTINYFQW